MISTQMSTPPSSAHDRPTSSSGFYRAASTLTLREMVRFVRQRSRIIGALGTPLVFWLIIGGGVGTSLAPTGGSPMSYMEYTLPGALTAILLFTSIFSMISIIDDRREGFMQGVLVAPVSRAALVLGKVAGASGIAVAQAALFLLLAPLANVSLTLAGSMAIIATMLLTAIALAGLGFLIAWRMESTQGFHAIMNVVLMPMLILSGAFFPPGGSATIVRYITYANPLTYAVVAIRHCLYLGTSTSSNAFVSLWLALAVTFAFAVIMFSLSIRAASRHTSAALT